MTKFQIELESAYWLGDQADEPGDLCLHGNVTAQIGEAVLSFGATVSSTGLYLLKTLEKNHVAGEENQMLPCCGHLLLPNKELTEVEISGCPYGIDWSVEHVPGGVKLTTESGAVTFVPMEEYRETVFRFADIVEAFYQRSAPKKPFDDFEKRGYTAFWNEWHRRRNA